MGRFFLTSRGSWGDINPFLGLGCELQKRGHEVTLILNEFYRSCAESLGFDFVPYGPVSQYMEEQEANRALGKPAPPAQSIAHEERLRRWHLPELRATYAALAERADPRDSVIVARSWTLAGRMAQERLGIPMATVYISPPESLRLWVSLPFINRPPPSRWFYDKLCAPKIDRFFDPQYAFINEFRAELGLDPVQHIQSSWFESPQLALGLWPDWLYPHMAHWSPRMRLPGFVLHETRVSPSLSPEVEAFLSAGEPPVVFAAGTFRSGGAEDFFSASVEVCRRLGRRGIFLSESRAQVPAALPESIATFSYVPLHLLLPRCAAIVHHGGIGTCARALEAGLPQLVVPLFFFDQPVNAMRLIKLGVANAVHEHDYRADKVAPMLQKLLTSARVRETCVTQARRMAKPDAAGLACDALEELLASRSRSEPAHAQRVAS